MNIRVLLSHRQAAISRPPVPLQARAWRDSPTLVGPARRWGRGGWRGSPHTCPRRQSHRQHRVSNVPRRRDNPRGAASRPADPATDVTRGQRTGAGGACPRAIRSQSPAESSHRATGRPAENGPCSRTPAASSAEIRTVFTTAY